MEERNESSRWIIHFHKTKLGEKLRNRRIIEVFQQALFQIDYLREHSVPSLASTNQKYDILQGCDYLVFSGSQNFEECFRKNPSLCFKQISEVPTDFGSISDFFTFENIAPLDQLLSTQINRLSYYKVDFSPLSEEHSLEWNGTLLVTRDFDEEGHSPFVLDRAYKKKGNRLIPFLKKYTLVEVIPHFYYDSGTKALYFISDGNIPVHCLISGLLYGSGAFYERPFPHLPITRLDYVSPTQKILHTQRYYQNLFGVEIPLTFE